MIDYAITIHNKFDTCTCINIVKAVVLEGDAGGRCLS